MSRAVKVPGKPVKCESRPTMGLELPKAEICAPIYSSLGALEDQCAALESLARDLEERLGPVLYPGPRGSGSDENDPEPLRSPVADAISRCTDRLSSLREGLTCLISRIEC